MGLERPGNHLTADDGNHNNNSNHDDQSGRKTCRDEEREREDFPAGDQPCDTAATATRGADDVERRTLLPPSHASP